jgi:cyclase
MIPRLRILLSIVIAICLPALLPAQQSPITTIPVVGPVYMIQGSGAGNVGILADASGVVAIDTMMANSANAVRTAIKSLPGGEKIRFLINTHWHSDHTDGNKILGREAIIVAHENVRRLLSEPQNLMGQTTQALSGIALPSITYSDKLTLYAGDIPIRLVHYPNAHTNGDTVVYIDAYKVLHMGDMFFNGLFPFLDVANGGDIRNWVRHLDTILADLPADARIIPGHGPLAGKAELKAFRDMLSDSADVVQKQINEGKSLEQIKTAGLPERFNPWTKGFLPTPQWLELVYQSLEKK